MHHKHKLYGSTCCLFLLLFYTSVVKAQTKAAQLLEETVYRFNNRLKYDSSKITITNFLQTPGLSNENKSYGYLYLSYTYKRLFDYPTTLLYLDSAQYYGARTETPAFYISNIACQKAYAYFDIHEYGKADSLMNRLRQSNYQWLNEENQSKIIMQEAYLLFIQKNYTSAEQRYKIALKKMQSSSPCDQPMIYGKLIELYAAMQNKGSMQTAYQKGTACADSCGIIKYNLYLNELMGQAMEQLGYYKKAIFHIHLIDSLKQVYNSQTHRNKLLEMEAKHQAEIIERQLNMQKNVIQSKNLLITLLGVGLLAAGLLVMLYLLRHRQAKMKQEKQNTERYTSQLLQKIEAERERISGHLHDSVNHELLTIKNTLSTADNEIRHRIDMLINDIRDISHNLHPAAFTRVGLAHSIHHLVERVQGRNDFMLTADVNYSKDLPAEAELQLFRIIQEAVSNMVKYSRAVAGKITVTKNASSLFAEIKDNGHGFDVQSVLNSKNAFGLHNIQERSKAAGGKAIIRSNQSGTTITVKIPLNKT